MTTTFEEANQALRSAVKARMDATPKDDPKMVGYVSPAVTEPLPEVSKAEDLQHDEPDYDSIARKLNTEIMLESLRLRGDGVLREQPGSLPFLELLEELRQLHFEKTAQYGGTTDPFENVTASAKCGVEPWRRALCDLSDCVVRMQRYANGQPVDYENALIDAANWSLICLLKLREGSSG
jgi:hypothetical protein